MTTTQTIRFDATSLRQVGSGAITAFLFLDDVLSATLGSIAENATLDGRYTGTVEDIAAATYRLVVRFNGFDDSDPEYQVTLLLAVGTYIASRPAVLDSATQAQIDAIEASTAGTVSGAGTGTEIFFGTNVTLTITVDADGNRSSVVVS